MVEGPTKNDQARTICISEEMTTVRRCYCFDKMYEAQEGSFINHNPTWRTHKYSGKKKEKLAADEETVQKTIAALENESIKYETYYRMMIAAGMRRGECCDLKWSDIDYEHKTIHVQLRGSAADC